MKLHVPSALLALGLASLVAFLSSQASPPPALLNPASIRVEYMPHPRDMVQITQGTPYVVPPGKLFVLTALGIINGVQVSAVLTVDGGVQAIALPPGSSAGTQPASVATGLTVAAGSVIDLSAPAPASSRAWGYLANQ